jgi:hypothetical protein
MQKSERAARERMELDTFVFAMKYGEVSPLAKTDI